MKSLKLIIVLIGFAIILIIGCSETTQSPVQPTVQTPQVITKASPVQSNLASIDSKGPIDHRVQGSANEVYEGKNMVWTVTAHEYSDGTFDGEYEINAANALDDISQKWNGDVLFLKVYGNVAVVGGIEKTGSAAGVYYDVFFVIDNGKNGKTLSPDQTSMYVAALPNLQVTQIWWNKDPSELMDKLGVMPVDKGNITVE